jgi:hypothetical protein
MKPSFTLPAVTKAPPAVDTKYQTLNITKRAPKLSSFAILTRTWSGGDEDLKALKYNNVFSSFTSAKAARTAFLKALASNG